MIETGIFLLLFATLLSMRSPRRAPTALWFLVAAAAVTLLTVHHMTAALELSF